MVINTSIYEDLITDLLYLRKDRGFAASRLRNVTTLLKLLGGSSQDFTDLKVRFTSAVNSLPDKYATETLLAAYALSDIYEDIAQLSARRKVYGLTIGLKTDAIAKHENAAIQELAIQLLTARYTMSPLPFSPNVVPHNAALHEYVEINTVVKNRLWQETRELYKIISLVNDIGWLEISSDIPATVTSTCEARAKTESSSGGLRHRFYFDKPLMRGQATALSFTMQPDKELADPDTLVLIEETRAFHEPTLRAKFTVQYMGEQPSIIWQYDHLAMYERPGRPRKQQLLTLDKSDNGDSTAKTCEVRMTRADFVDLYGGMYSGVAWEW